ncbi:MAG: hypothetical protein IPO92_02475 [Saprospiraceae bacterium]|nr:hypothetical protein [Saprospiraceae bacterium]
MKLFLQVLASGTFLFVSLFLKGQHTSIDLPLILKTDGFGILRQSFDISLLEVHDFVAVSILLEGNEMNDADIMGIMKTSHREYKIIPFTEEKSENKFVSEIIYLSIDEAGRLDFELKFSKDIDIEKLKGKIHIFSPQPQNYDSFLKPLIPEKNSHSDCECPIPPYVSRIEWGVSFGLDENIFIAPAAYTDVTHLIVHHSAGTNVSSNWKGVVASIFDFHVFTNGWQDIGYNWLIDPEGVIYTGRGGGDNVKELICVVIIAIQWVYVLWAISKIKSPLQQQ